MQIYALNLNTVVGIMIAALAVWMGVYLIVTEIADASGRRKAWRVWYALNAVMCVAALFIILKYTVFSRGESASHIFRFIRTAQEIRETPELIREMVMNAFLFFPFGVFFVHAVSYVTRHPIIVTVLSALALSLVIEVGFQYGLSLGTGEMSDVITNTVGAAIGSLSLLLCSFAEWIRENRKK